jgi:outer membrane protein
MNAQIIKLTLNDAILLAQKNSLDYKIASNISKSAFWDYRAYKSGFLPKLSLSGTLPDYYRTINSITLPNGQSQFVPQNLASSGVNLNLTQSIPLTGGSISIGSSLRRIDNFGNYKNTAYTAVPLSFSYSQNSLFYNEFKWQRKIQPLRFEESKRQYLENLEEISYNTIYRYFDLLKATVQLKLDEQNLKNIDTLIKITQARFEIGTVQLNDILQSKVSLMNAKRSVLASTLNLETAKQNLIRYLTLDKDLQIELQVPESLTFFNISNDLALKQALSNRKFVSEFERRRLQAQQEIERTKSQTGPTVSIRANLGLTQTANTFNQSYEYLLRNQAVVIGFNIPLMDWNVNKSNRKRAEANLELEINYIAQQQLSAEQEITYQVMKWNMQEEQIEMAKLTRELANQRYGIAKQKYAIGSITYTDFNNAQIDKDRAETDYINSLLSYWASYYLIRKITLYDFNNNKRIESGNWGDK